MLRCDPLCDTLGLHRHDLLLVLCIALQVVMRASGMETWHEVLAICLFHLLGVGLDIFKVPMGSWSYSVSAWARFGGVPLFGGRKDASVASYVCQAWRRLQVRFHAETERWSCRLLAAGIYLNFLTNQVRPDARYWLFVLMAILFWCSRMEFSCYDTGTHRRMPVIASFLLIGLFIWGAENSATSLGASNHPNQHQG